MSHAPSLALSPLRRFYFEYGYFLEAYTAFETLIEILLGRELQLTNEETSIFASIGFGAKFSVLSALLARSGENDQKLRLLKEAKGRADRNGFAHSFIIANKENQEFSLIRRIVTNGYMVTKRSMTHETMQSHAKAFYDATHEILTAFGMTYDDVTGYQKWIAENAPDDVFG